MLPAVLFVAGDMHEHSVGSSRTRGQIKLCRRAAGDQPGWHALNRRADSPRSTEPGETSSRSLAACGAPDSGEPVRHTFGTYARK